MRQRARFFVTVRRARLSSPRNWLTPGGSTVGTGSRDDAALPKF